MTDYLKPLDSSALAELGIDGWSYGYADRVRFHELDSLNHVNNAVYLRWFETVRVQYLQDYGLTNYTLTGDDPVLVVRAQSVDYLKPLFHNETYVVTTRTSLLKPSSLVMEYGIFVGTEVRATGSTVVVSLQMDAATRRAHKPAGIACIVERDSPKQDGL